MTPVRRRLQRLWARGLGRDGLKRRGLVAGAAVLLMSLAGLSLMAAGDGRRTFVSSVRVELPLPPASAARSARPGGRSDMAAPHGRSAPAPGQDDPLADLVESGPFGPLPKVGRDGRRPFFAYARPFDLRDSRPKIAILIVGLGLREAVTDQAQALPANVSLQFSPYAPRLERDVARARAAGHEVLLDLPMEPLDFPHSDPGPHTLLAEAPPGENLDRLMWVLSRTSGYVGLAGESGRFGRSDEAAPMLESLAARGLALVEIGQSALRPEARAAGLPYASTALLLDREPSPDAIEDGLAALEAAALEHGSALGVLQPYPISLDSLRVWADTLADKGLALAPVSALLIEGAGLAAQLRGQGSAAGAPNQG